jgi:hypothetical protein
VRKIVAIVTVLVVLARAVFANIEWSASAAGLLSLEGFSEKEKYTDAYGGEHQGRLGDGGEYSMPWLYVGGLYNQERRIFSLGATITNEAETLGAWLSVETSIPHQSGVSFSGLGFVWWQPVKLFKMQLGLSSEAKGDPIPLYFVHPGFVPVKNYGSAINSVSGGVHSSWNPQRVHHGYGRESVMAATFEFFPIDNLYVTTSTPFEPAWNGARGGTASIYEINVLDVLAQTAAQVAYSIPDIGTVSVTWDGGTMQVDQYPLMDTSWLPGNGGGLFFDDPAFITAGFTFDRLYNDREGTLVYLGFDAPLPSTRWRSMYVLTQPATGNLAEINEWRDGSENYDEITVQRPFGIDLRAAYVQDGGFRIVGGVAANFGGYTAYKPEGELQGRVDMPFTFGVTINPQYDLGSMNVGLVGEFKYHGEQKNLADPYYMFNIAPYMQLKIPANGSLWAAVVLEGVALDNSDKLNPNAVKPWKQGLLWSVPVGLRFAL